MSYITITKEFTRKAKDLSPAALVLALQLANYIGDIGLLVDSNGKPLIIQDIQKLSGYSVATTKRSMAELAKQNTYVTLGEHMNHKKTAAEPMKQRDSRMSIAR